MSHTPQVTHNIAVSCTILSRAQFLVNIYFGYIIVDVQVVLFHGVKRLSEPMDIKTAAH